MASRALYRPVRVGDTIQTISPKELTTATVELVSLGYTVLRDTEKHEVIAANSVMVSSVVIRLGGTRTSPDPTDCAYNRIERLVLMPTPVELKRNAARQGLYGKASG